MHIPNVLANACILETELAVFIVRQHLHSSLYDRFTTRPFLMQIEKLWICYQILVTLSEAHQRNVCHGDLKTENVLLTTQNCTYLVDFSGALKPTYLPVDNPCDFSYYFDTSARRICYLAPERFVVPSTANTSELTPEMDIFSLGCVIAEVFLEGHPLFTFAQLLRYRTGEYDPAQTLERIDNLQVRQMITQMISLDPRKRLPFAECLQNQRGNIFPEYFYTFLHSYFLDFTLVSGNPAFNIKTAESHEIAEADSIIERLYYDFADISRKLNLGCRPNEPTPPQISSSLLPVSVSIPKYCVNSIDIPRILTQDSPALLFITLLCSVVRNCLYPISKLCAIDMLLAFGVQLDDQVKLERIVPYLICLVGDIHPLVRINTLTTITQLVCFCFM